jgi:HPt (histidine-containing phosphotransfer) domain-containing protein
MYHGPGPSREFDPAVLAEIRELGGDDLADELITLSRQEIARQRDALDRAVTARDAALLRRAAHAIGGSSATIGTIRVTETAGAIERRVSTGDVQGAEALVVELGLRWEQACLVLDEPVLTASAGAPPISDRPEGTS